MLLLVQPEYPPSVGGMQTHAVALARGLYDRGHEVCVITYAQSDDPAAAAAFDASQPYQTFRILSRLSYWQNVRTLLRLVERFRPRMLYSSTTFYGIVRDKTRLPVVCRSVGNDVMRCWVPYPFHLGSTILASPFLEHRIYSIYRRFHSPLWLEDMLFGVRRELVRRAACAASAVIANSQYTNERLLELGVNPGAISIVSGGVDTNSFIKTSVPPLRAQLGVGWASPLLLTVCRLVTKKGLDTLLEAVAQARNELPDIALLVVGDGPERKKSETLASALGLDNNVRFVGRVPHEEIGAYYHSADCFVLASRPHNRRNGWSDVETMGRVICEANAAGVPVIATNTGGVPSLIRHGQNGILVSPGDPVELGSAIVSLWNNPPLREHLSRSGITRAHDEFDWDVVIRAFEDIFRQAEEADRVSIYTNL